MTKRDATKGVVVLGIVGALLLTSFPLLYAADAFTPPTATPTIASGNLTGPAWLAIHFHADVEGNTSLSLGLPASPAPYHVSWIIYHDNNTQGPPSTTIAGSTKSMPILTFRCPGLRCISDDGLIVAWIAGPVGSWNWTLRGEADASLYGATSGADVGEIRATDFQAPANLRAQLAETETNVVAQGTYAFAPAGVTLALANAPGIANLTVDLPDGSSARCYCAFTSLTPSAPGDVWGFHLTEADAETSSAPPVILYAKNLQIPN